MKELLKELWFPLTLFAICALYLYSKGGLAAVGCMILGGIAAFLIMPKR